MKSGGRLTGVVDRYQDLLGQGLSSSEIARQVRDHQLVRLRRGAFVAADQSDTPEARHLELLGATLPLLGSGSVLSHASAAVLHGLPVPMHALRHVHVTRDTGGRQSRHTYRHRARLPAEAVVDIGGKAVTSCARTVVDLARWLDFPDGVAVVDAALRLGVAREALSVELDRANRRPGNAQARRAVDFGDARAESPGESRSRVLMHRLGLPMPTLQREFCNDVGEVDARVDFDWAEHGACGEFDGEVKYGRLLRPGRTLDQTIRYEKEREERLRQHGRWTIRWSEAQLHAPESFRRLIESGLTYGLRGRRH